MEQIKFKALALKFKTNLFIAKVKEEIALMQSQRIGHETNGLFTERIKGTEGIFSRFTNFN